MALPVYHYILVHLNVSALQIFAKYCIRMQNQVQFQIINTKHNKRTPCLMTGRLPQSNTAGFNSMTLVSLIQQLQN